MTSPLVWGLLLCLSWAIPPWRHLVESSMSLTMLVQLPSLLLAGSLMAEGLLDSRAPEWWRRIDTYGLTSWTLVSVVAALWMLPITLDLALLHSAWEVAKIIGWVVAGVASRLAWSRTSLGVKTFFLGNLAWMTTVVGLLYIESEQRLCVSFLLEDQLWAGRGLVCYGGAMVLLVMEQALRASDIEPCRSGEAQAPISHRADRRPSTEG